MSKSLYGVVVLVLVEEEYAFGELVHDPGDRSYRDPCRRSVGWRQRHQLGLEGCEGWLGQHERGVGPHTLEQDRDDSGVLAQRRA